MPLVDIDTDGRLATTAAMRELFRDDPGNWDPRGPGKASRQASVPGRNGVGEQR